MKTSELLQEVIDYCCEYNIPEHFDALDKAINYFKRLEELGVDDYTTIKLVKMSKWARLEFTIQDESEEKDEHSK